MTLYENQGDRSAESRILHELEQRWTCVIHQMPQVWPYDALALRNFVVKAVIEVKVKRGSYLRLGCFYFDCNKADSLRQASQHYNAKGLFVVEFEDGLFYMNENEVRWCPIVTAGRTDRQDPSDYDKAYCVPYEVAKRIR